jgi:hypothetical protein
MHWERTWKWTLRVLALILATRMYFVQELLTLFLFFTLRSQCWYCWLVFP